MPDPVRIVEASAICAALAALGLLLGGWPWRQPRAGWVAAGGALGLGSGFLVGACVLGLAPHFPPQEDRDRLLLVLLPAAVGVEVVSAFLPRRRWLAWSLRLVVASGAARVLLHGSVYLTDSAGVGLPEWSPEQTWLILGGLAVALAANGVLLDRLGQQQGNRAVLLGVALAAAGSGVAVMLSGYATGGQLGFLLAGGLVGAALASLALAGPVDLGGTLRVSVVGLFGLLVAGRFFAELTTTNAMLLFFAPLAGSLPARLPWPRWRAAAGVLLVAVPVAVAVTLAAQS
jgi:hypothetical protein